MSETITEMILPGTYIEVRAEGLIGVSGIATGNIGVVGTASRGPLDRVVVLGSYAEAVDIFGGYDRFQTTETTPALSLVRTLEQVFRGGGSTVYAVRVANLAPDTDMAATTIPVRGTGDPAPTLFSLVAKTPGTWADAIAPAFTAATVDAPARLELRFGRFKETFAGTNAGELADAVNAGSSFVAANGLGEGSRAAVVGSLGTLVAGGPNGAAATATEIGTGLDLLAREPVNIVVVGGLNASAITGAVLAHLEATENDGRERIALVGASSSSADAIVSGDVPRGSNPRLILVAPGIVALDAARAGEADRSVELPPPYAAALVAGRLATLAPHVSLTNKDVAADGLAVNYSRAQQKRLLQNGVLVLQRNLGIRVLQGISTDTGAFRPISVRRIVDFAKEGVRRGANPYIGRLNNSRVRAALKATLDGFLSGMVLDEKLIGYELDVTATRAQEIAGQAIVTMTLRPTFSIDFIKVIMNLE